MTKRTKSISGRRGSLAGWVAAAAAILYVVFAQRPLQETRRIAFRGESPAETQNSLAAADDQLFRTHGRAFALRADQQGAEEIDASGKKMWSQEFGAPITTVSAEAKFSAWGLLDGTIHVLDGEGRLSGVIWPAANGVASSYPCVYATAISGEGERVAAVYGLDPQFFLVFEKRDRAYTLLYKRKLATEVRSAQAASFSLNGKGALARTAEGIAYYDVSSKAGLISHADYFSGQVEMQIEPVGQDGFAALLERKGTRYLALVKKGGLEAMFPVERTSSRISIEGTTITVSGAQTRRRYEVVEP